MKKLISVIAAISASLMADACLAQTATPMPSPSPSEVLRPCQIGSWTPELHSYYGARETMADRMGALQIAPLSSHRVFLFVVQREDEAEVRFYERQENGTYTVKTWSQKNGTNVMAQIDKAILTNEGQGCVGEECSRAFGEQMNDAKPTANVTVPDSAGQAFAEIINKVSVKFFKVTLVILC